MKIFAILLCVSIAPVLAAIDGTVVNRTTGKPQAGATVSLYKLGQSGMEAMESVKSGADGKFTITQDAQGPRLLQTAFDGVVYNQMLPPGSSTSGIAVAVYNSSRQPGSAKVAQHIVFFEPSGSQMSVNEIYAFQNDGNTTWNDPESGTLQFYLPAAAKGIVRVDCTAPNGMPVRRAADKTARPDIYKVDFPIKPGETRIDLSYVLPYAADTTFEGKLLYKGGPTRLVAPRGVTLKGDAITALGEEPRTQAEVYEVKSNEFKISIAGSGTLRRGGDSEGEDSGSSFEQIMPRVWQKMPWILAIAIGILGAGFLLLYRASEQPAMPAPVKGKDGRRRR